MGSFWIICESEKSNNASNSEKENSLFSLTLAEPGLEPFMQEISARFGVCVCVCIRVRARAYIDTLHMAIFIDARKAYEIYCIFRITGSTRLRWVGGRLLKAKREEGRNGAGFS